MKKIITTLLLLNTLWLKAQVNHYETIVAATDNWSYFIGSTEPGALWTQAGFDDATWDNGSGRFGYGYFNCPTTFSATGSFYLRIKFDVQSVSAIESAFLDIDYDDAFVAYINGTEIARAGITGNPPTFDQYGEDHEGKFDDFEILPRFALTKSLLESCLVDGENVLAIQVHNHSATSSDILAMPYLFVGLSGAAQVYRDTPDWFIEPVELTNSNIPIIVIQTEENACILDEPKTKANIKIIHNTDGDNEPDDIGNIYDGNIGIEIRGRYSAGLPQTPYGFETRDNAENNLNIPLFHMPAENDWILLPNFNDKVMLRNVLSYQLYNQMGHYAPRTKLCEVIVNKDYKGIYVLTEKIKQDDNRVAVSKLSPDENTGDDLTGGYIFKIDYYDSEDDNWIGDYSPLSMPGAEVRYVYHDPKPDELSDTQKSYIQDYISSFESVLYSADFENEITGYRAYVDITSFIDFFIIGELSRNTDAYKKSKYYFKDKDSKGGLISSGPVWDFDWAYKNINGQGADGSGWSYFSYPWMYPTPNGWIERMMEDPYFRQELGNRYHAIRRTFLSDESIDLVIDSYHTVMDQAQARHFQRWPILGKNLGAPEGGEYQPDTYDGEITKFKNWISVRLAWLDDNMPEEIIVPDDNTTPDDNNTPDDDVQTSVSQADNIKLRVFPNPTSNYVYVESNNHIKEIILYNSVGQLMNITSCNDLFSVKLNLDKYPGGIYALLIKTQNDKILRHKLIISR